MSVAAPAIFDRMSALADTTRSRLLLVLERHELTVGEMCQVLQLPQSTVSRHLKLLGDEGWVSARAEGTSRRYRMPLDRLEADARQLWTLVRPGVAGLPSAVQDAERLRSVLAERATRSREFFSSAAGEWDRLRADLFGRRADLVGLLGLLDEEWTVGDLGCGTGQVAATLAPFVHRVVAVDSSPAMLDAARARLAPLANVEVRAGELESLPVDDGALDAAVAFLVLHYVAEPAQAVAEAARALRPGGRLLVMDMMPHDREEYRQAMGHLWQGFAEEQMGGWMTDAGLSAVRYLPLPPDPSARGPRLFCASARRLDR
ncbi:ArsR/SmtB family transcription factor [Longimicrobium terrae]|uniref:ArsR family transcriptional regulator n=1 Tax=Longimicrobium terrae TaxID=1639882 RepID=A0A841H4A1_9BACT|nr:metalloregulator ArsR/SmtB family transcription factor [Longimicrobium terrae]MBB4638712.1 ArsR family transcriptional regulator [Longimicrobium terrae]MBB6072951.1 ArsR family transcriptional regulator [Longimicrobium terrae]NNC31563.1 metalloregulator ArsR/SmtB family transcription factor [Longimicrobium terrae]